MVLLPASTALVRLAPPSFMAAYTFHFKQKEKLDEAALKAQLTLAGYTHVSQVVSPGEYAVRGGLIDLFPMGSPVPYRVDLFGDEVDSIRTFDPDTQRSLYPVPEVRLLPGREFPMDEDARTRFRARWREKMEGDPTKVRLYKDIGTGLASGGIEYYMPLFFDETATIFDYLAGQGAEQATLVLHGEIDEALKRFWTDTRERHRFLSADRERPDPAAGRTVPEPGGVLRPLQRPCATRAARPRRSGMGARPARPERRPRHARTLATPQAPGRDHALPRADRGRDRRPPREPAGTAARQQDRAAQRRHAGRFPGRHRTFRDRGRTAGAGLLLVRTGRRHHDPVRHRDRTLRHLADRAPAPQAGAGQRTSTR